MPLTYEEREKTRLDRIRQIEVQRELERDNHNRMINAFRSIAGTEGMAELRKWLQKQKELCLTRSEGIDIGEVKVEKRKQGKMEVNIVVVEKDNYKTAAKTYLDVLTQIDIWTRGEIL